jgi:hypothetical protein
MPRFVFGVSEWRGEWRKLRSITVTRSPLTLYSSQAGKAYLTEVWSPRHWQPI